ncbi:MAG TPA: hypothetical protein DD979_18660 [Gammaproteobacteria bacterium]|nr:hypothetical protein [Gammaproteobacteria bacterium]
METRAIASFNFVVADRSGDIGFLYNASIPRRAEGYSGQGCAPGDRSALLWRGVLPLSANPQVINPTSGWVYSANATPFFVSREDDNPTPQQYPINIGNDGRKTNRARRLAELLADDKAPFSRDYLAAITFDEAYSTSSEMATFIRDTLNAIDGDTRFSEVKTLLSSWDLRASADSRASLLAHELFQAYHAAKWWNTEAPEIKGHLIETIASMKERYGRIDPALGDVVRLRRGQVDLPLSGGDDTLRMIRSVDTGDGYRRANFGDGLTLLVEWTQEGEQIVKSFHQYGAALGRPASDHYSDQSAPFARKEWKRNPTPENDGQAMTSTPPLPKATFARIIDTLSAAGSVSNNGCPPDHPLDLLNQCVPPFSSGDGGALPRYYDGLRTQ